MRLANSVIVFFSLAVVYQVQCADKCSIKNKRPDHSGRRGLQGCSISIKVGRPTPLLLKPPGPDQTHNGDGFYLPSKDSGQNILIGENDVIHLACPGEGNYLYGLGEERRQEAHAKCVRDRDFDIGGVIVDFREIYCEKHPKHTARRYARSTPCYVDAISIEIGFLVGTEFFRTIDICFDESTNNNLWSKFQMFPGILGSQKDGSDVSFVADDFYKSLGINDLYKNQREAISKILSTGSSYAQVEIFQRGHMAARADFVYNSQQRATYHFVNAAPQWKNNNNGNWKRMEKNVRDFAAKNSASLVIYTGTYGVLTLPSVTNHMKEIWLHLDSNGNVAVPVPKLFWKVVYQPSTKQGIALLTVNNPYILDDSYNICQNVCNEVTWLTWKPDDVQRGRSNCCHVSNFRAIVTTLPNLDVTGLLT